ncbi:MAG: GntR family transcriptional regulator [Pseudomonadota bacterium]
MRLTTAVPERRTSADIVFETLYDRIVSLGLMPGEKMSEADIAEQFGVSRQPVRDAFNRLGNMNLLLIQPQRATLVRKFSISDIAASRFVRLAVELEIAKTASRRWTVDATRRIEALLEKQDLAVRQNDVRDFLELDQAFHAEIAEVARQPEAFEVVLENKARLDRICVLSLKRVDEMARLVEDHRQIAAALARGNVVEMEQALRLHLSRIDETIDSVRASHAEYFEA